MRKKFSALEISKAVIAKRVKPGDLCIDATAGRGNDTAFLAELTGETGRVISFDIQQQAVNSTLDLLREKGFSDRAQVYLSSHEDMDKYAEPGTVSCITFNLGWLPGGDHTIHTGAVSSINALKKALTLLKPGGLISLIIYYGRDTGFEEKQQVLEFVKTVDSSEFSVIVAKFANRPNCPPIPVFIFRE